MGAPLVSDTVTIQAATCQFEPLPEGQLAMDAIHHVWAQDGWFCLARRVRGPSKMWKAAEPVWHRTLAVRVEDITSIEIEQFSNHAKGVSKLGLATFGVAGGLWNSGKRVGGGSGILVMFKDGRWLLLVTTQMALAVKAVWTPLCELVARQAGGDGVIADPQP
jgi:hypothetical protein